MKASTTLLRCGGVGSARKWLVLAMLAVMMVSVQASSIAEAATTGLIGNEDNKNDVPISLQRLIEKVQSNLRERQLHPGHGVRARPAPLTVKKTTAGIARKKAAVKTPKGSRIRKKATAGFRKKASRPKSNYRTRPGGARPAPPSGPMGGTRGRTNARPPPRPVTTHRDPYGKSSFCIVCASLVSVSTRQVPKLHQVYGKKMRKDSFQTNSVYFVLQVAMRQTTTLKIHQQLKIQRRL